MTVDNDGWDQKQLQLGASFLQSMEWAEFQKTQSSNYHLLEANGWSCLAIEKSNRFGKYLFAPLGPTLESASHLKACLDQLSELAKSTGADWLKIEPVAAGQSSLLVEQLRSLGAMPAIRNTEPALTRVLDLTPPVEEILAGVSQSTRSFIRKNQREAFLNFRTSTDPADVTIFVKMLETVAARKRVGFFSESYFSQQAKVLMPKGLMRLELALEANQPVAAAIIHDFGSNGSYTYAASLPEGRDTNASALLLWRAIVSAKDRGIRQFDLFGIAPDNAPSTHPWHSFSTFKKKFGGSVIERAGTWDIPLSQKYKLYRAAQKLHRRIKRH
jgi:lipid II:glycine glycyltransferase (peptidoglycan interpeptide bridge formation enzyme)